MLGQRQQVSKRGRNLSAKRDHHVCIFDLDKQQTVKAREPMIAKSSQGFSLRGPLELNLKPLNLQGPLTLESTCLRSSLPA